MKDINLMPLDDLEKIEFSGFLKKVIVIVTITFFILIPFVAAMNLTKRYLSNRLVYVNNQFNDPKYAESELIKNELDELLLVTSNGLEVFESLDVDYTFNINHIEFIVSHFKDTIYLNNILLDNYNNKMTINGTTTTTQNLVLLINSVSDKNIFNKVEINELRRDINKQVVFSLEFFLFGE